MFNRPLHWRALLLSLSTLTACTAPATLPPWQKDPGRYPAEAYLRASGTGEDQADAQQRALANLAQIFGVTITDQGVDFTQSRSTPQGPEVTRQTGRTIDTFTQEVLEGARVVDYWQAPQGQHYALAVLEKMPAAQALRRQISSLDRDSSLQVQNARSDTDPFVGLRRLEQARRLVERREALQRKMDVLGSPAPPPPVTVAALEQQIRNRLQHLPVTLDTADPRLRQPLQSALARLGVPVEPQATYRLQARLNLEPMTWEQGWYWQRGVLLLSVDEDGQALAARRWPVKAAATDRTSVEERLLNLLSTALPGYILQLLTGENNAK